MIYQNLKLSNPHQDLYLTEEQIIYCLNLTRYFSQEFEDKNKLRQMFNLAIATTQKIYLELSLTK